MLFISILLASLLVLLVVVGIIWFIQSQKQIKQLEQAQDKYNILLNRKEVGIHALVNQLSQKNQVLEELRSDLRTATDHRTIASISEKVIKSLKDTSHWKKFIRDYELLNQEYFGKMKDEYKITGSDIRLIALIQMNLTSKEIASVLNVSDDGIKKARFRLRKKMNLFPADSLEDALILI